MLEKNDLKQIRLIIREELERAFRKLREIIAYQCRFEDLEGRVKYTELKLGIESGK